jgi:alanyl-tRNA synthetase
MLFGEKYGDEVRVVEIDGFSNELCGGTHVRSTAEIGPFRILTEGSVGSGARRIEAVTAGEAWTLLEGRSRELDAVRAELEQARREAKKPKHDEPETAIVWQDRSGDVLVAEVTAPRDGLKDLSDRLRAQEKAAAVLVGAIDDGKVALVVNLDDSVVARGVDAVQLVRSLGAHIGGGGGGRPTLAEAGGKKPEGLRDALEAGRDTLVAALQ